MFTRTLIIALLLLPVVTLAQSVYLTEQSQPYEIVPVEAAVGAETSFLGELTGSPIMYELRADQPFTLTAAIRQLGNKQPQPLSLIVIRQNDRGGGVQEIGRMNADPSDWDRSRDGQVGLSFITSPAVASTVQAGTYRIEVSTPENSGKYELLIGDQVFRQSYGQQLADVRLTQQFFGYNFLIMIGSSLVYVPLLVAFLSYAVFRIWRRYRLMQASDNDQFHGAA